MFAPLTDWLIRKFLWRGTLVVCSAILLNIVVCGAVFRPLRSTSTPRRRMSSAPDLQRLADAGSGGGRGVLGHARWSAADVVAFVSSRLTGRSRASDVNGSDSVDVVAADPSSSSAVSV